MMKMCLGNFKTLEISICMYVDCKYRYFNRLPTVQLKDNITLTRMYQIATRMLDTLYSALLSRSFICRSQDTGTTMIKYNLSSKCSSITYRIYVINNNISKLIS